MVVSWLFCGCAVVVLWLYHGCIAVVDNTRDVVEGIGLSLFCL